MSEPRGVRQFRFSAPPGATEILLVRHGESAPAVEDEPFPLVDGHGDPPLSDEGRAQAERVATRLADAGIDAIYVTTLRRTAETAAPLAARLGLEVVVEPDLREVHLGEWEGGLYRHKVVAGDPLSRQMMEEQRWDVIPGAETNDALRIRVCRGIERIAAAHPDQRVAVFSHGGAISSVLHHATGSEPWAFIGSDNASISHIVVTDSRWILRRYNETNHLEGLA